ncbi:hypothetical protein SLS59_008175 [Nothophoma quercina]|uniref:Uncharacterized protein n=1 Tax=Nothophoma quercina TaxID=749835 RepID=A0ABR3QTP3_9PLEO
MKIIQLAALFGGAVSAVQPLVGRVDGTTTTVVFTTSTYTITKCAASVTNCPVASATMVFTSTTVMSVTTTICPVTSTAGLPPPQSGYVPSSALSSALPTNSPGTTDTLSDSIPTSYSPSVSAPSSAYVPPVQSSALPIGPSRSIDFSVSLISPNPSLPTTVKDAVPTSFPPDASGPSSHYLPPAQTSAQPTGPSGSDTAVVPQPSPSGSVSLPGSLTDSIPTSFPPGTSASGSSSGYVPVQPSSTVGPGSRSVPVVPSGSLSTATGTYPAVTSTSSSAEYPGPSPPASTIVIDGSTRITSRLTLTSTNYVTAPLPSSNPSTNTATDAVPTSHGTGYLPSESGYPHPSGSANGTIIAPTPSYIEVPVNMGQIVAVGQSSIAAIIIALAFALFA